ncbi:hypothetical protein PHLCEN_2v12629 [Hermanssonia centrifuga]|uniref:Uncharacterized protein n=1 Tax=Hermanssonia centrifuga TaxID=98765 RepID=A0A2R6NGP3_9APHY|nr:hypothetical protein PHLCEN_2v12629 [Hermanssonia centrifuga]
MPSSPSTSNASPASSRFNNHHFKLTPLEAAGLEVLQADFTVLQENRTANELFAEQTETKEDLLVGLDVSPELAATLPNWPKFSHLLRALCESGTDQQKPPSRKQCPACKSLVVGVICKRLGKASLHMHHPGPCPVQLAAIHEVRKRDMELLVKKMKSCAERAVTDNQSEAGDSPGKSKSKRKGKGKGRASTQATPVKLETPATPSLFDGPLTPLSQLSATPMKLQSPVKEETPVKLMNKRGAQRTPKTPKSVGVPQVVDDMFTSNTVGSNSAGGLFPVLGKRKWEQAGEGEASPSTSSSSSLPSVGEIIRASKVRFCDDMLHYVFDRQTQRTASSPTSPTPVRHKVQHAEGSIVRQPMPKEVLIAPGDEVLTVAAKKQTVANEPIEVEDDDLLRDDNTIARFWCNKRVFIDKTPISVNSDSDSDSELGQAGKTTEAPVAAKREEVEASFSSDDGATVISSHPEAFVDLRVVVWIEVGIYD